MVIVLYVYIVLEETDGETIDNLLFAAKRQVCLIYSPVSTLYYIYNNY